MTDPNSESTVQFLNNQILELREQRAGLMDEIAKRDEALRVAREALQVIAKPRSLETDGSGSAEEFEELYDFWQMASAEKLNKADEALARISEIMEVKNG